MDTDDGLSDDHPDKQVWIDEETFYRDFGEVDLAGPDPVPTWRVDDNGRRWINWESARAWWATVHPGAAALDAAQRAEDDEWRRRRDQ